MWFHWLQYLRLLPPVHSSAMARFEKFALRPVRNCVLWPDLTLRWNTCPELLY